MAQTPFHKRDPRPLSEYEIERMIVAERLARTRKPRRGLLRRLAAWIRRKSST